ncbi:MAG: hypothetical protein RBR96_02680 [Candidatus Izemoplasmatales bacterium]|jgi:hypothetical protein|nr:hypothetical protein [Candidatus Izemoplasmatales bacterium]
MEALFIVLNDLSYLDQILSKFVEMKVRGATILDSMGMARAIMDNEGLNFLMSGPFQRTFESDQKSSKTIFTVIPEPSKVEEVVREVRAIVETSNKQVIGFMFTVPVSGIYPMKPKKE